MKYFIDAEFIEAFHKPFLGKRRHFIDLISIGIVAQDGREYYAISSEFDVSKANKWVRENVIAKLPPKTNKWYLADPSTGVWAAEKNPFYKSNKKIMRDIVEFICPVSVASDWADVGFLHEGMEAYLKQNPPEFYGYYCDYDWVVFCSLFGTMMDLPKGFPMYCRDLKQMLDEKILYFMRCGGYSGDRAGGEVVDFSWKKKTFQENLERIKSNPDYPKQTNEHNALADARWNFELYKFLTIPQSPFPKTGL